MGGTDVGYVRGKNIQSITNFFIRKIKMDGNWQVESQYIFEKTNFSESPFVSERQL